MGEALRPAAHSSQPAVEKAGPGASEGPAPAGPPGARGTGKGVARARAWPLGRRSPLPPGSPPAIWAAFAAQSAWKSLAIGGLLAVSAVLSVAVVRLSSRPPEVILIGGDGSATPVRRSMATDALLQFLADHARPPELTVVRFAREFLQLALALNSSTVEESFAEALRRMAPELRHRIEAEAGTRKLLETWRRAERKIELAYEEIAVEGRTPGLVTVRATISRHTGPLLGAGGGTTTDRVEVDLVVRPVPPTLERPDGLEVVEWRMQPLPSSPSGPGGERVAGAR